MGMNNLSFMQDRDTLELLMNNLDEKLGVGGSSLVFKTLKLVYKIDEDMAIQHPELLREKLEKLLGSRVAEHAFANIHPDRPDGTRNNNKTRRTYQISAE